MNVLTRDAIKYTLSKKHYQQSILLCNLAEETVIPESGVEILVDSDVFKKIFEFMESHMDDQEMPEDFDTHDVLFTDFDEGFFLSIEKALLFRLIAAANYLNMPLLLELCCKVIATSLKEKTTEEIKRYLDIPVRNVKNEVNVQKEYKWIDE
ncbi:S-phase kinase-associated protein 1 [Nematocida minor]|uniref:S-phase kinase-associated protein 1 n=1 Tax=Nematocida minor TaxID=1912983 RepID=UPI00221FFA33|nr:S-phase kinase-associated protein 1 [Nematocida minor]KAI5192428.1 S-phase kinase-associated protein 1 [Nematocida minor]